MCVELDRTTSFHRVGSCSSVPSKASSLPLRSAIEQCPSIRPRTFTVNPLRSASCTLRYSNPKYTTGTRGLSASPLLITTNFVICIQIFSSVAGLAQMRCRQHELPLVFRSTRVERPRRWPPATTLQKLRTGTNASIAQHLEAFKKGFAQKHQDSLLVGRGRPSQADQKPRTETQGCLEVCVRCETGSCSHTKRKHPEPTTHPCRDKTRQQLHRKQVTRVAVRQQQKSAYRFWRVKHLSERHGTLQCSAGPERYGCHSTNHTMASTWAPAVGRPVRVRWVPRSTQKN